MQAAGGVGTLLGREAELALLYAFLERRPEDGAAALLLEGEAGIGKTAVWRAATEAACERGFRVLRARPSEAERTLSFAALADLLGDAHEVIEQLPAVQRRPLAVALLLEQTVGPTPDRRRSASRCSQCCARSPRNVRCSSLSTTPSGSIRPPRPRSRSLFAGSPTSRCTS